MDASRTAQIAPVCAREAGKEFGLGRAARSGRDQAEPEGFKCIPVVGFQRILRFAQKRFTADVAISAT